MVWVLSEVVFTLGVFLSQEKKTRRRIKGQTIGEGIHFPNRRFSLDNVTIFFWSPVGGSEFHSPPCFCMIKIYHYPKELNHSLKILKGGNDFIGA